MSKYTCDFETCTWLKNETYVWAYAICEIDNPENIIIGNNIEDFMKWCSDGKNPTCYFHNLKFDGEFILYWLFKNGFTHIRDKKDRRDKTFTTLISDMGMFYTIEVYFKIGNKSVRKVSFIDSLKILNMSVDAIAKTFGLPISKLTLDYNKPREIGYILTNEEKEYIKHDVKIVALALKTLFDENLTKMTIGSNALTNYKEIIGKNRFNQLYVPLSYEIDNDLRKAYKGGFTYVNDIYRGKEVGEGIVLDVNSLRLYPSVMYEKPLPFGEPYFFEGKYEYDVIYPLYIQQITCSFKLKKNKIPTIQVRHSHFKENEYLTSSNGEIICLTLTNIDLELFFEQYDVEDLNFECGWKFKCLTGLFTSYIDKWIKIKIESTQNGNKGMRQLAKLMLNSLYGKFATSQDVQSKIPFLGEDEIVHYKYSEKERKDGIYIPIGCFITAYAREKTIRTSQAIKDYSLKKYGVDMYLYSDTDSIHTLLPIDEVEQFCDIDDVKLGAWKHESTFSRAKFIRQKCYLEEIDNDIKITCAGMPKSCYDFVEWEKFKEGFTCGGKLTFKHLKGGVKLVETEFTIKKDDKDRKEFIRF
ncbi:MAG: hypothetical protein IKI95_05915 [Clostridia bacterium]|nr:hypothetical protein [Clostridia bacterium]